MCLGANKAHKLHMNISVTLKPGVKDFKYAKSNQELDEIIYSTNMKFKHSFSQVQWCISARTLVLIMYLINHNKVNYIVVIVKHSTVHLHKVAMLHHLLYK